MNYELIKLYILTEMFIVRVYPKRAWNLVQVIQVKQKILTVIVPAKNEELNIYCPIPKLIVTPLELYFTWEGLPKETGIDGFTVNFENSSSPNTEWTYEILGEKPSWITYIGVQNNKVIVNVKSAQAGEPLAKWTGLIIKSINPEKIIKNNLTIIREMAPSTVGFKWIPDIDGGASCEN